MPTRGPGTEASKHQHDHVDSMPHAHRAMLHEELHPESGPAGLCEQASMVPSSLGIKCGRQMPQGLTLRAWSAYPQLYQPTTS